MGNWFVSDFEDTAICPHKTDYCPDCFEYKTSIKSLKQKIDLFKVNYYKRIQTINYFIIETRRRKRYDPKITTTISRNTISVRSTFRTGTNPQI